jgi:uncharacterized iron-regulated protein
VTLGASTPLPEGDFNAALELQPETHPVDIRPSTEQFASRARFGFSVLENGEACVTPVRYSASRLGRPTNPETGSSLAVSQRETAMGKGRVYIDAPGIWWITAEKEGKLASLTFEVPENPGPDQYAAFTSEGEYLDTPDLIAERLAWAEVIFIGEKHDDPVAHLLEKEILAAVHRKKEKVALSLEMFETDVQPVLDGYLAGHYMERHFLSASRPWPRYGTDYKPMVEYARENGLAVIGANAPRRIVNLVSRRGKEALTSLPEEELRWLPPVDYYIPIEGRYVDKLQGVFTGFGKKDEDSAYPGPRRKRDWIAQGAPPVKAYNESITSEKPPPSGMPHGMMMKGMSKGNPSQSLWDATMAWSIARYLEANPAYTVVQVNGSFHSDEHLGTVEQLLRYRPGTQVAVVSLLPHPAFPAYERDELAELGEVIIVTDPAWQPESDE